MNIVHVPFTCDPNPCSGTEVYVDALCRFLANSGIQNVIAAPGNETASYVHECMQVHRFAVEPILTQEMMYGAGDPTFRHCHLSHADDIVPARHFDVVGNCTLRW